MGLSPTERLGELWGVPCPHNISTLKAFTKVLQGDDSVFWWPLPSAGAFNLSQCRSSNLFLLFFLAYAVKAGELLN